MYVTLSNLLPAGPGGRRKGRRLDNQVVPRDAWAVDEVERRRGLFSF